MTVRSWIRKLFVRTPRTVRKAVARCRPALEALEDRLTPAGITVTVTDGLLHNPATVTISTLGPEVSLRDAITDLSPDNESFEAPGRSNHV